MKDQFSKMVDCKSNQGHATEMHRKASLAALIVDMYLYDHHLGRRLSFAISAKVKPWWVLNLTAFSMVAAGSTSVTQ